MRFLTSRGCSRTSNPATVAVPAVGGRKQVSMRMVVVLPAPLGPRKPTIWPLAPRRKYDRRQCARVPFCKVFDYDHRWQEIWMGIPALQILDESTHERVEVTTTS